MKLNRRQLRRLIMEDLGPDKMVPFDDGGAIKKIKSVTKAAKPKLETKKKVQSSDVELQELQNNFNDLVNFLFNEPGGQFDQIVDIIYNIHKRLDILEKKQGNIGQKAFDDKAAQKMSQHLKAKKDE